MRAAAHRRLTPVLAAVGIALAVLCGLLFGGMGSAPSWNARPLPRGLGSAGGRGAARVAPLPLSSFAASWEAPLFAPDRKPVPSRSMKPAPEDMASVALTGTVLTRAFKVAMVHDLESGKDARVHLGETYKGWTLEELGARRALFSRDGAMAELALHAAGLSRETASLPIDDALEKPRAVVASPSPAVAPFVPAGPPPLSTAGAVALHPGVAGTAAAWTGDADSAARRAALDQLKDAVRRRRAGETMGEH